MALISLDTNVLVYAFQHGVKRDRSLALLDQQPVASVQTLNEYAHVAHRKFGRSWLEIGQDLEIVRTMLARVDPITEEANRSALRIAERYRLSFYDALILAVALSGGAGTLYSEDMQHDLVIDGKLRVVNPFAEGIAE